MAIDVQVIFRDVCAFLEEFAVERRFEGFDINTEEVDDGRGFAGVVAEYAEQDMLDADAAIA
jgi:hypothetical protein